MGTAAAWRAGEGRGKKGLDGGKEMGRKGENWSGMLVKQTEHESHGGQIVGRTD